MKTTFNGHEIDCYRNHGVYGKLTRDERFCLLADMDFITELYNYDIIDEDMYEEMTETAGYWNWVYAKGISYDKELEAELIEIIENVFGNMDDHFNDCDARIEKCFAFGLLTNKYSKRHYFRSLDKEQRKEA